MASGKTHDRASRLSAFTAAGAVPLAWPELALQLGLSGDPKTMIAATTGVFVGGMAGLILSPDLDLVNKNNGGCMALNFWRAIGLARYWRLYGTLPHHSPISHWPLLGTLSRLFYTLPQWGLPVWALMPFTETQLVFIGAAIVNLAVADTVHWILDGAPYAPGNHYLLRS